ncbi:MAG: hypothetical protein ACI31M_03535 [Bacilli bacterium]
MNNNNNENPELEKKIQEETEEIEEQYRILKDEEEKEDRRKVVLLIALFFLLFCASFTGATISYLSYKHSQDNKPNVVEEGNDNRKEYGLNYDTNGDGIPDLNIDYDGDGVCDFNCDANNNGRPDTNLMNHDTNNDGMCDLNCDTDRDGFPDLDLDFDNDGICDMNCDTDGDREPDLNIDTDRDKVCDMNCDTDGDGKPDDKIAEEPTTPPNNNEDPTTPPSNGEDEPTPPSNGDNDDPSNGEDEPNNKPDDPIQMSILFTASNKFEAKDIIPGWKSENPHEFSVKNTGNSNAAYDVVFKNIFSDFENPENLRYSITCNNIVLISDALVPISDRIVLPNEIVAVGETNVYKVYYRFVNTGTNQDNDQGKTYHVEVDVTGRS